MSISLAHSSLVTHLTACAEFTVLIGAFAIKPVLFAAHVQMCGSRRATGHHCLLLVDGHACKRWAVVSRFCGATAWYVFQPVELAFPVCASICRHGAWDSQSWATGRVFRAICSTTPTAESSVGCELLVCWSWVYPACASSVRIVLGYSHDPCFGIRMRCPCPTVSPLKWWLSTAWNLLLCLCGDAAKPISRRCGVAADCCPSYLVLAK